MKSLTFQHILTNFTFGEKFVNFYELLKDMNEWNNYG